MLGKLVLIAIQAVAALMGAPFVMRALPAAGDLTPLIQAVVFAVIVWVVGLVGSFALKDVAMPSPRALAAAIVGALIGAVITMIPQVMHLIPLKVPAATFPIIGAIVGYFIRK